MRTENGPAGTDEPSAAPNPSDMIRTLDAEQRDVLLQIGRHWSSVSPPPDVAEQALPVEPDLGRFPRRDQLPPSGTGRVVPMPDLSGQQPSESLEEELEAAQSRADRWRLRARRFLIGAPLRNTAITHERMRKLVALPVLSADALSSVAYGPEAMLVVLALAGTAGLAFTVPIAAVIAVVMITIGASYRQTIRAYPNGGGSYVVSTANLGASTGLVAAAGLLTDYVLTVAVSISSGVAAITSAVPGLTPATVPIGVGAILLLLAGNLRGIRQAGVIFAAPTYAFIVGIGALVVVGLIRASTGGVTTPPQPGPVTEGLSVLLIMRAFASGSTAMTGIEAISNAAPAFRPTQWRNARTTLTWMVSILVTLFVGLIVLIQIVRVVPKGKQTVLSQLAHLAFGTGPLYVYVQVATAAVLLLAANTAYNDFPRVLFQLARADRVPRLFLRFGDRLAFSNGIALLTGSAIAIYVVFGGATQALIPLYAVGVFLAFTLSQSGMVVHWWRHRGPRWRRSLGFNAFGAVLTGIVLVTAVITKFTSGAWVALVAIGLFLLLAGRVKAHYAAADRVLRLRPDAVELPVRQAGAVPRTPVAPASAEPPPEDESEENPLEIRHLTIVPLTTMDRASLRALAYAGSLGQPVLAVHISPSEVEAQHFNEYWRLWGNHFPLEVIVSPFRAVVAPLVHYIEALHRQNRGLTLTVILPEVVARRRRHRLLHSRIAARLRRALRPLPKVVITTIPFHL